MFEPTVSIANLEDYAAWHASAGYPMYLAHTTTYTTDDAIAVPVHQYYNYQVELYIIHNPDKVPTHGHPGVQVMQSLLGLTGWGTPGSKLIFPETHGTGSPRKDTTLMLTYERWDPRLQVTSLAVRWWGVSVGPIQESLVKKYYPTAVVSSGWIDTKDCP